MENLNSDLIDVRFPTILLLFSSYTTLDYALLMLRSWRGLELQKLKNLKRRWKELMFLSNGQILGTLLTLFYSYKSSQNSLSQ